MAHRAASAASLNVSTGPALKIKVNHFEIDPEIRTRRSITSDYADGNGNLGPCTVYVSAGGILRGEGFVDPADTVTALILSSFALNYTSTVYDFSNTQIILDRRTESGGSQYGYAFGTAKLFPSGISGRADSAGMLEVQFEIHSQGGVNWSSTLTAAP